MELDTVLKIIENLDFNIANRVIRHAINLICLASAKCVSFLDIIDVLETADTRYVRSVHLRVAAGAVTFSTALTYELFIDRPHLNSHQSPSAVLITTDEIDYERS